MGIDREAENLLDSRALVCGVKIREGSFDPYVCAMGCWILVCQSLIEGTQRKGKF